MEHNSYRVGPNTQPEQFVVHTNILGRPFSSAPMFAATLVPVVSELMSKGNTFSVVKYNG